MKITPITLLAALGLSASVSASLATDFYVQPLQPGPVQGTPLQVVNLQASLSGPAQTTEQKQEAAIATGTKWISLAGNVPDPVTAPAPALDARTLAMQPLVTDLQAAPVAPWKSVNQVLSSGQVKAGDRILLLDGYHGNISLRGMVFSSPIVIASAPGATAHVDTILATGTRNVIFRDLKVWPRTIMTSSAIVRTYPDTSDLAFVNLDIRGASDAGNYMNWTLTDWRTGLQTGMMLQGPRMTVTNTRTTAIQYGIVATGADALLDNNIVDGFSGDGMRALGNNSVVTNNKIQNCFFLNDGIHRDGFQSYSIGPGGKIGTGTQYNLVLRNNKIFEWASPIKNSMRCRLQGISLFDGTYDGFRIENNIVVVSAYHGIAIAGAQNTIVANNTVVNPSGAASKYPWIRLAFTKNGIPSRNSQVVNNLAGSIVNVTDATKGIYVANNVIASSATVDFVDFARNNLALRSSSPAVDKGDPKRMATDDITGSKRFKGKAPDAGAYESF
jgi:parallel beta-helix repeat protein